jgi:hypothetical protein
MDVVHVIEKAKTDRNDKPLDEIKIVNLTLHDTLDER